MKPSTQQNIELKARLRHYKAAREMATKHATAEGGVLFQTDTYFCCSAGRLKLREQNDTQAELISYDRVNRTDTRPSHYRITAIPEPSTLKAILADSLGIRVVVRKQRELFFYHNVRIHLDRVESLGDFLEFEAVVEKHRSEELAVHHDRVGWLRDQFGIQQDDLIASSYSDMLLAREARC